MTRNIAIACGFSAKRCRYVYVMSMIMSMMSWLRAGIHYTSLYKNMKTAVIAKYGNISDMRHYGCGLVVVIEYMMGP